MKILVLQDYLRSGGTERQAVLLANACAAAGHKVTLLTFRPGGALASTVSPEVTLRALQSFDTHLDFLALGLGRAVERIGPDVALLMGRMANCQGQFMVRELRDRWPRSVVIATMRTGKMLPLLFRFSLRHVHHVVANSRDARDSLVRTYAVPAEKITVIHNALVFPPDASAAASTAGSRETLRSQPGATPRTTVFLCVAMFRPEKNQHELIEIVAGLPAELDWQLWLAGEGPARAACEQLVQERKLGGRVKFLGFHRDPSALYRAADVAVHASWSEALSNFLIEAQAHGLPAVAYQAQGIEECFLPGETGWAIPRDDREAFRSALLQRIRVSAADRATLADRARRFARETFDPARQVEAYLDLFARLTYASAPRHDQQAAH
jgi:glycosyltransferase involved in cell wall biosynthesis